MKPLLKSNRHLRLPAPPNLVQVGPAPPEDKALRGRNLSAELESDKRQAGPPCGRSGWPEPAGICKKAENPPFNYQRDSFLLTLKNHLISFLSTPKSTTKKTKTTSKLLSIFSGKVQTLGF